MAKLRRREGELGVASPVTKQAPSGRCSILLVLAAVTLGLLFVISNRFTALADVLAPLTGHLMGLGLAASLALLVPRRRLQVLTAGMMLTVGLHGWLALARCCGAPPAGQSAPIQAGPTKVAEHRALQSLTVLALNTWHGHADTPRLRTISRNGSCRRCRPVGVWTGQAAPPRQSRRRLSLPGRLCRLGVLAGAAVAPSPRGVRRGTHRLGSAGLRLGSSRRLADHHRHASLPAKPRSLAARAAGDGARRVHRPHRQLSHSGRRSQYVALVQRVSQAQSWNWTLSRCQADAELAGLAAPAGGARSYIRLAGARRGSGRHRARRRLRPSARVGAARAPARCTGPAPQPQVTPCSGAPASRRRAPC